MPTSLEVGSEAIRTESTTTLRCISHITVSPTRKMEGGGEGGGGAHSFVDKFITFRLSVSL